MFEFYLIMNVGVPVGSTNGWFPKNRGLIVLKVCFSDSVLFIALIGLIFLVLLWLDPARDFITAIDKWCPYMAYNSWRSCHDCVSLLSFSFSFLMGVNGRSLTFKHWMNEQWLFKNVETLWNVTKGLFCRCIYIIVSLWALVILGWLL